MSGRAVWQMNEEDQKKTRLYQLMQKLGFNDYDRFYQHSIDDIAWFWDEVVKDMGIQWFQPYHQVLDLSQGIMWPTWFTGGKLNIAYNALDKWLLDHRASNRPALRWEGEDGAVTVYTYQELAQKVSRTAQGLLRLGLKKGDRVAIYMPMVPETVIAMLACAKIGAIFTPVFSGFAPEAVAVRISLTEAKLLITADGFYRRGKVIPMKEAADQAVNMTTSIHKVVVVRRLGREIPWKKGRDVEWSELESPDALTDAEVLKSDWPLMILFTSGTTGRPKGVVHTHSGFPIKAAFDAGYCMDLNRGEVMFWVTDMGWMMGPFLVFGTLLNGATMLMYEGAPNYPTPDRLWRLVENHQVTHLGISPSLVRLLMKEGDHWVSRRDLSSLRLIGSTGEPWNETPWLWLFNTVGGGSIPIFNYSGGTEISGGILGNVLLKPIAPAAFNGALPGMDAEVFNKEGKPIRNEVGELVLKQPWVGMASGFWKEAERYEKTYWSRWPNIWVHGDWVKIDADQFWYITGRSDDTLNLSGKRMGPAEFESVLVEHEAVVEAATVGVADQTGSEQILCFVVLKPGTGPQDQIEQELMHLIEEKIGKSMKPAAIYFVNQLPKTRNGKLVRRVIKSVIMGEEAGDLSALENPEALEEIARILV